MGLNAQNDHILERLKAAQEAVAELIRHGLTVTEIRIEGTQPRISLLNAPGRRCRLQTHGLVTRIRQDAAGHRIHETSVALNGCEIHWRH